MAIPSNIKDYLLQKGANYSHKTHALAFTSQEVAEAEHVSGKEFAKTVILIADGRLIMCVLPADHIVDFEILKKQLGCMRLSLASEKEFIENFPSCEPGAMPPFGKLFQMPIYCDSALAKHGEIEFNAGTHADTIRMTYADFAKLEKPMVLRFSETRTGQRAGRNA
jgi:Ala-tRNA(Pro) deacylase